MTDALSVLRIKWRWIVCNVFLGFISKTWYFVGDFASFKISLQIETVNFNILASRSCYFAHTLIRPNDLNSLKISLARWFSMRNAHYVSSTRITPKATHNKPKMFFLSPRIYSYFTTFQIAHFRIPHSFHDAHYNRSRVYNTQKYPFRTNNSLKAISFPLWSSVFAWTLTLDMEIIYIHA